MYRVFAKIILWVIGAFYVYYSILLYCIFMQTLAFIRNDSSVVFFPYFCSLFVYNFYTIVLLKLTSKQSIKLHNYLTIGLILFLLGIILYLTLLHNYNLLEHFYIFFSLYIFYLYPCLVSIIIKSTYKYIKTYLK